MVVIMVAEDREHAVWRRKRRQGLGGTADVLPIAPRHVIAAENNQIRSFRHDQRHSSPNVFMRNPAASMDICEKTDP